VERIQPTGGRSALTQDAPGGTMSRSRLLRQEQA
jgi:hypothetical protein